MSDTISHSSLCDNVLFLTPGTKNEKVADMNIQSDVIFPNGEVVKAEKIQQAAEVFIDEITDSYRNQLHNIAKR